MDAFNAFWLRKKYSHARIMYADFYGALIRFYDRPQFFGGGGGGGPFNFNPNIACGAPGSTVCEDATTYVSWDGVHLTDAAYRYMAMGPFTFPPLWYLSTLVSVGCLQLECQFII
ncbi:hypothetical protein SAY86_024056 [Trapa natans]|uniref:Uncharacterized protein n=1 Tax=Trapa natans TaxID=22666 RepID=A0AAN7RAU4_TRANT|nr:hypothetical protein SAY86_024056 [Trapa natans]